jgi:hypothetical protein
MKKGNYIVYKGKVHHFSGKKDRWGIFEKYDCGLMVFEGDGGLEIADLKTNKKVDCKNCLKLS